jgi:hypothetical protein
VESFFLKRTEINRALNSKKEFFTLDTLLETEKNLLEFTGGTTTLYRILESMGFKYKIVNYRKILCEQKPVKILLRNLIMKVILKMK